MSRYYVIIRVWWKIGSGIVGTFAPKTIDADKCERLTGRYYIDEDGDLAIEGTILCPGEFEGELRRNGFEIIKRVTEEEARELPRFMAVEFNIKPAY